MNIECFNFTEYPTPLPVAMPYPNLRNSRPHEFGEMLAPRRGDNVEVDRATGTLNRSSYFLARNRCIYLEARIDDLKFDFRSFYHQYPNSTAAQARFG